LNGILFIDRLERKTKAEACDELDLPQAARKAELAAPRKNIKERDPIF
jgi:hypothetical protein